MPQDKPQTRKPFRRRRGAGRGFTLIELMIVVAIMGVLAAIAIPSFNKSVRRARTSEALTALRKVYDGSVVYYDRDHTTPSGDIVAPQFPSSAGPTPVLPGRGVKLEPDPALWSQPTWQALDFAVSDPHYYAYQYVSLGTRDHSFFWAIALGDLDGDGVQATFIRGGTGESDGVKGFAGVVRINPLE